MRAERSNYFDAGISQIVVPGLTLGVDAYYKLSKNLIDEGQFGAPIILTAFNYAARATVRGRSGPAAMTVGRCRFTPTWPSRGPWAKTSTRRSSISQPDELAYIQNNFIHLDHDQTWSGSAGAAYTFNRDSIRPTRVSADLLVQSGLRASTATIPNGIALPTYATVNLSAVQQLRPGTQVRLDILNRCRCDLPDPQRHRRWCRRAAIRYPPHDPRGHHSAVLDAPKRIKKGEVNSETTISRRSGHF